MLVSSACNSCAWFRPFYLDLVLRQKNAFFLYLFLSTDFGAAASFTDLLRTIAPVDWLWIVSSVITIWLLSILIYSTENLKISNIVFSGRRRGCLDDIGHCSSYHVATCVQSTDLTELVSVDCSLRFQENGAWGIIINIIRSDPLKLKMINPFCNGSYNYLLVRPVSRREADIGFRIMHSRFLLPSSQYVSEPHNPKPPNGNPQSYLMEVMICKRRCDAAVSCELWTDVPLVVLKNSDWST